MATGDVIHPRARTRCRLIMLINQAYSFVFLVQNVMNLISLEEKFDVRKWMLTKIKHVRTVLIRTSRSLNEFLRYLS